MKLKHIVESLDDVDEKFHDLYTKTDDGYEVQVEGVSEMKRAKAREKERAREAAEKAEQLQDQLDDLTKQMDDIKTKGHKDKGDIDALEKSWQEKLSNREAELTQEIDSYKGNLQKLLVDQEATKMAADLAVQGSADVLMPHIKARLAVDSRDGEFKTVVLGTDGKPSASTMDELREEIASNPAFAPIVVGSKASGSGAAGGGQNGGGAAPRGNMGGDKAERTAAISAKHPELAAG